jgi:ribosomal protein S4
MHNMRPHGGIRHKTFFQQKWYAKKVMRAYHGEHIKEGQWERMFSRRFNSVVNMDPKYMAKYDGSEQAAGRGSGTQMMTAIEEAAAAKTELEYTYKQQSNLRTKAPTPYMQMVFAPMERRLDIAIFRALFASSARQARQFVVHGSVKVNGKKVRLIPALCH